ncbi:HMT1 [Sanghuangporus weigelae]
MAGTAQDALLVALLAVRISFVALLLATALSLLAVKPSSAPVSSSSASPIVSVVVSVTTPRRSLIISLFSLIALTYFLDGFALVLHSVLSKTWQGTPSHGPWIAQWSGLEVEAVGGLLASGLLVILGVWKESQGVAVWTLKRPKAWTALALVGTIVEVVLLALTVDFRSRPPIGIPEAPARINFPILIHMLFPAFRLLVLIPLYVVLAYPRVNYVPASEVRQTNGSTVAVADESTSLLAPAAEEGTLANQGLRLGPDPQSAYGTFRSTRSLVPTTSTPTRSHTPVPSVNQDVIQTIKASSSKVNGTSDAARLEEPTWGEVWRRIKKLTPYLWPKNNVWLQFLAFLCILVLLVGRLINIALPLTLGKLIDVLEKQFGSGAKGSFWPYLLAYVGLRFLQGGGGFGGLNALRESLWAPVMQYSDREMSQMSFNHLLSLSLSFHLRRKTGEVLRILDRGSAINRVFELMLFNIVPTFIDIIAALVIFVWKFDWTLAVVVAFVMFSYIAASIILTSWRTRLRRQMNDRDIVTRGIHTDCLLNYETVKYFGGEAFENERYSNAIKDYQALEYRVILSLNLLNLVQNLLMTIGFLVGGMIVALRVTNGLSSASEFVVFVTYLAQLYGPLNQLGFIYRQIITSLVDTERLLKLLDEPTDVNDKPGAPDLIVDDGEIEFDNVSFSYDDRITALSGVSFKVPKGSSVALVGESGSGKSTILRLLYRFYDLKEGQGRILIDGQDIRDVTQASLRKAIGVVPQDSVLFNASIAYNIAYGKLGASREEIEAAAKAAQIHERILTFPDGYDTKVGERGVRLSGGEKQRVAIARTLLKNPPILLLDEATSALDTSTEKDIQNALQNLVRGRSSLSIAHRLSTIASADLILVLKDGQIVEQGTHRELLEMGGIFATMWADQIRTEDPQFATNDIKQEVSGYSVEQQQTDMTDKGAETEAPSTDVPQEAAASASEEAASTAVADPVATADGKEPTDNVPEATSTTSASAAPESAADESAVNHKSEPSTSADAPVKFPGSESPVAFPSGPVSFPSTEEPESIQPDAGTGTSTPPGGVTFDASVRGSPRSGTPDPADPKRKRTASQNFQRFARRVSLVGRRQGSTAPSVAQGSPLKDESVRKGRESKDEGSERGEASGSVRDDSPAASVQEGRKMRDRLKKRLSMGRS